MVDRIVISLLVGVVGGFFVWGAMVLIAVLNDYVPWYYALVAAALMSVAAFILDWRTRTE